MSLVCDFGITTVAVVLVSEVLTMLRKLNIIPGPDVIYNAYYDALRYSHQSS